MSIEENKAIVNQFVEKLSKGDTSAIDEMTTSYIEDIITEGNKVVIRATRSGKQTGKLYNIEPTGKPITNYRFNF